MIKVKCLFKFRDNSGKIVGYRIQNEQGETLDTTPEQLKMYIYSNQMSVVNLKLTQDGRLIDCVEGSGTSGSDAEWLNNFISIMRYTEKGLGLSEGSISLSDKDVTDGKLMQICAVSEPINYKGLSCYVSIDIERYDKETLCWCLYNNNEGYICEVKHHIRRSIKEDKDAIVKKIKTFVVKVRKGMK